MNRNANASFTMTALSCRSITSITISTGNATKNGGSTTATDRDRLSSFQSVPGCRRTRRPGRGLSSGDLAEIDIDDSCEVSPPASQEHLVLEHLFDGRLH